MRADAPPSCPLLFFSRALTRAPHSLSRRYAKGAEGGSEHLFVVEALMGAGAVVNEPGGLIVSDSTMRTKAKKKKSSRKRVLKGKKKKGEGTNRAPSPASTRAVRSREVSLS